MKATEVLERYKEGDRNFQRVNLRGQSFKGKNLAGADFSNAKIHGTDFTGANLTGVKFCGAQAGLQERRMVLNLFIASVVFARNSRIGNNKNSHIHRSSHSHPDWFNLLHCVANNQKRSPRSLDYFIGCCLS
ncbi:pentapeptide repeat-containing protein [Roseofilum casamattae]|uniref:Pentapeptide repeat-containing protein n=1 Tax=Roseofilum casamattae BLCC-M143 TaxID=3022442 RepID=A0ABT7BYK8_9CYAN|nr:pentapeptide repeat-containing protein [Roseofilum casamattae]MDJ1184270.1 pentapeptide repeat-containing protein [Roseofilum casamattae BLCC-M143]